MAGSLGEKSRRDLSMCTMDESLCVALFSLSSVVLRKTAPEGRQRVRVVTRVTRTVFIASGDTSWV